MAIQFLRRVRVIISKPGVNSGVQFDESLRIAFEVSKRDGSKQNECKVKIYNLSKDSLELIRTRNAVIQLYAGYGDVVPLIYKGIVTRVTTDYTNGDVICNIESKRNFLTIPQRDPLAPAKAAVQNYIKRTFTAQTSILDGLKVVVSDVKTILGDYATQVAADLTKVPATPARAPRALTISGPPDQALSTFCDANALDWWMEDGTLRFVPRGDASREQAFLLSPDSGLIGSPKAMISGKSQKATGAVSLVCLLNGELRIRRAVQIVGTRALTGWYLIRKVSHKGDSGWDTEFYTTAEATPIKARPAPTPVSSRRASGQLGRYLDQVGTGVLDVVGFLAPSWATFSEASAEIKGQWFTNPNFKDRTVKLVQRKDGRWTTSPVLQAGRRTYTVKR
jgi:hypothetical protein